MTVRAWGEASYIAAAALLPVLPLALVFRLPIVEWTAGIVVAPLALALAAGFREGARPALDALDVVVALFVCLVGIDVALSSRDVSTAVARALAEGAPFLLYAGARVARFRATFAARLFGAIVALAVVVTAAGAIEYARWGESLIATGTIWKRWFWVADQPRLYSVIPLPVTCALFLDVAVCAAAARWLEGGRWMPATAVVAGTGAIVLTLTPFAVVAAIAVSIAAACAWTKLRSFGAVAAAAIAVAIVVACASDAVAGFLRERGGLAAPALPAPAAAIASLASVLRPPTAPAGGAAEWIAAAATPLLFVLALRAARRSRGGTRVFLHLAVPLAIVFPLFEFAGPTIWMPTYILLAAAAAVNEEDRADA